MSHLLNKKTIQRKRKKTEKRRSRFYLLCFVLIMKDNSLSFQPSPSRHLHPLLLFLVPCIHLILRWLTQLDGEWKGKQSAFTQMLAMWALRFPPTIFYCFNPLIFPALLFNLHFHTTWSLVKKISMRLPLQHYRAHIEARVWLYDCGFWRRIRWDWLWVTVPASSWLRMGQFGPWTGSIRWIKIIYSLRLGQVICVCNDLPSLVLVLSSKLS